MHFSLKSGDIDLHSKYIRNAPTFKDVNRYNSLYSFPEQATIREWTPSTKHA